MAAHNMNDAITHSHPDVPFSTIGDSKIIALTTLASIFKSKFKKPSSPVIIDSPLKATEKNAQRYLFNQLSNRQPSPIFKQDHKQK
jgi:hypothetical protein